MRRCILFITLLFFNALFPGTTVYIWNNTPYELLLQPIQQTGGHLKAKYWQQKVNQVSPYQHIAILNINRNIGIKSGLEYIFKTLAILKGIMRSDKGKLALLQKVKGKRIGSQMWQKARLRNFTNDWTKKNRKRLKWKVNEELSLLIKYDKIICCGYDDIMYVINEMIKVPKDKNNLRLAAYNVFLRTQYLFNDGQIARAARIPCFLKHYDMVVFSEVFDESARKILLDGMKQRGFNYFSNVSRDTWKIEDSGIVIASKHPIKKQKGLSFGETSSGFDAIASKGIGYVVIRVNKKDYHLFATHLQADFSKEALKARIAQIDMMADFIKDQNIPSTESILIAGDFNVDQSKMTPQKREALGQEYFDALKEMKITSEYDYLIKKLDVIDPQLIYKKTKKKIVGYPYTVDELNQLYWGKIGSAKLDYIFYSKNHAQPQQAEQTVQIYKTTVPYQKGDSGDYYTDLSDHYLVQGDFVFPSKKVKSKKRKSEKLHNHNNEASGSEEEKEMLKV